ncbi:MAG: sugar kinase [Acidobacteria bacterium]|nr:sugar kinase [Acidobacteriota bacterium]
MPLSEIVKNFSKCRLLIIGDLIADEFVYGEITRISREAPVMILRHERTETMPGGAGNAASNVASLAGQATVLGVVGKDLSGEQLLLKLNSNNVNTEAVLTLSDYQTPTKSRILAGSFHSTRQQVIRLDREPSLPLNKKITNKLTKKLENYLGKIDAVIVSDYNYGVVTKSLLTVLKNTFVKHPKIPIIIDSRFHLKNCLNFTAATPNQAELEALVDKNLSTETELIEAGEDLRSKLALEVLLLTRGSDGMILFQKKHPAILIPVVGSKEPVDVTGAGDTVIATFTLALASGASFLQAAKIANHAGAIVVMKRGTATLTISELLTSMETNPLHN